MRSLVMTQAVAADGGSVDMLDHWFDPQEQSAESLDLLEEVLHRSAVGDVADVRVSLTGGVSLDEALDTWPPAVTIMIELFVPSADPLAGNVARPTRHQSLRVA